MKFTIHSFIIEDKYLSVVLVCRAVELNAQKLNQWHVQIANVYDILSWLFDGPAYPDEHREWQETNIDVADIVGYCL